MAVSRSIGHRQNDGTESINWQRCRRRPRHTGMARSPALLASTRPVSIALWPVVPSKKAAMWWGRSGSGPGDAVPGAVGGAGCGMSGYPGPLRPRVAASRVRIASCGILCDGAGLSIPAKNVAGGAVVSGSVADQVLKYVVAPLLCFNPRNGLPPKPLRRLKQSKGGSGGDQGALAHPLRQRRGPRLTRPADALLSATERLIRCLKDPLILDPTRRSPHPPGLPRRHRPIAGLTQPRP